METFKTMGYFADYYYLKNAFNQDEDVIQLYNNSLSICNLPFESRNCHILPGEDSYDDSGIVFPKTPDYQNAISPEINEILNLADSKVFENRFFKYSVFMPGRASKADEAILLFHGLNEKNWFKYLPWAKSLVELTGKAVILFPIAFHMNRAPADWSDFRTMNDLKYVRQGLFPAIVGSSFANVAISTRLHILPQRFFWSGVQTFYDVLQLLSEIKSGHHPLISTHATIDFFAYSVGAFLTEILLMDDSSGYLNQSRLFMFCGGPVFNRMSPVRKSIIDSEANIALYSFFLEHLDNYLKKDKRLAHYFRSQHSAGMIFKAMLDYYKMIEFREEKLRNISSRIKALALKKDLVVPHYEVLNTLKGAERDIPVEVQVLDFPYQYSHENPFPVSDKIIEQVEKSYQEVFSTAARFLTKK